MSKSRKFSIYLLKKEFTEINSLKDDHQLEKIDDCNNLPEDSTLYVQDKIPKQPWWKNYWGIEKDLKQTLKGALVFMKADDRSFALTFGHTHHNLKEDSYEYDFGLRTTLNAIDSNKLKSTDILEPGNARRQRIQSPTASDLTFFEFDEEKAIIKNLSGRVSDNYKELFTNVSGASNLRISSKLQPDELQNLCKALLEIYKKEDYKENFPNIQNIVPVKDPAKISQLNKKLVAAFRNDSIQLVMTVPEIIDYQEISYYKYSGGGRSNNKFSDVYIANYREYLNEIEVSEFNIGLFKKHKLNVVDENRYSKKEFSIYKCFLYDCQLGDEHFHLCDSNWYRIDKDYINELKNNLDPYFSDSNLPECNQKYEKDYNIKVAQDLNDFIYMDTLNVSPSGQTQVEPCDLFTVSSETATMFHIKISTRSSALSHLFNQGLNSVKLIKTDDSSRNKLKKIVREKNPDFLSPIENKKFKVVYGIITKKDIRKGSENLPIFSRISLQRSLKSLKSMDVSASVVFIKDNVDRKSGI